MYGVIGALMAIYHREVNGGKGQVVDVALYESVFSLMESLLPEYDMLGFVRERSGASLPGIVPSNTYSCRDGKYVVIGANSDGIFKRMMLAIGREDLANDPGLASNAGRVPRTEELDQAISAWTSRYDMEQVLAVLNQAEVPASKIYSIADIVNDVHYQARQMIQQFKLKDGQTLKLPGIVPKLSETPGETEWLGPELGQHSAEILSSLGIDSEQQKVLKQQGII
jgi:formyl-CoA transferase